MTDPLERPHRHAALTLLRECPKLSHKEAGFLGNLCVAPALSERQGDWLARLLRRHGLPAPAAGEAQ